MDKNEIAQKNKLISYILSLTPGQVDKLVESIPILTSLLAEEPVKKEYPFISS